MSRSSPRAPRRAGRRALPGLFAGPSVRLLGGCGAQHERPNAKGIHKYVLPGSMLGKEMSAGLHAGPIQKMCDANSVPSPDFGENLTSLIVMFVS